MIVVNTNGKKLWGDNNCIPFKSICAAYKMHYKNYRGSTGVVYNEDTVDINNGVNTFTISAVANTARYLDLEFFDADGNKFLPYNWEYVTKLKGDTSGNGILTIFADGTVRIIVENKLEDISDTAHSHVFTLAWDSVVEDIDNRKVTVAFDFE